MNSRAKDGMTTEEMRKLIERSVPRLYLVGFIFLFDHLTNKIIQCTISDAYDQSRLFLKNLTNELVCIAKMF